MMMMLILLETMIRIERNCFKDTALTSSIWKLSFRYVRYKPRIHKFSYSKFTYINHSKMGETAEDLNYDCNYNMFLAKTMISNLGKAEDRQKVVRWLRKLTTCNRSMEEMKLRNDFMYYLVVSIQNGELQPPFTDNPPQSPLPSIAHLLPGGADIDPEKAGKWAETGDTGGRKPLIYENSPDGGAFLAAQPVPRCGAFCYLAVVARNPKKD